MSLDNPILNRPYDEPERHYRTLSDGTLDYSTTLKGRRQYDPAVGTLPRAEGAQGSLIDQQAFSENLENELINLIRREVGAWRASRYESGKVTRVTRELLLFWFANDERPVNLNLFFAQREAVETAVWLNEVAPNTGPGKSILARLAQANTVSSDRPEFNLPRIAFKMATGTGKTVVMAMLVLYHFFNRREYRNDTRFADYFLLVAPGITIRDRLGVLYVDTETSSFNDIRDYYRERGLVPRHLERELPNLNAKLVITNYHAFELRAIQGNKRSPFDGKLGSDGKKQEAREDASLMIRRVLGKFRRESRLLILNDEAHHCYLPGPGKGKTEARDENERAAVWITGIAEISKRFRVQQVYDLSATPYYLNGSGYEPYSLFPWVTTDFGLIEAIESGLVKIPFLPESDTTQAIDGAVLRNLYDNVRDELPKKGKSKEKFFGDPQLPALVKNALSQFTDHYAREFKAFGDIFSSPPVFIVVCNNTNVSSEVYKYLAGYDILDENGEAVDAKPGHFDLFSNYDKTTRKPLQRPPTLLIDSAALEEGDQVNDEFKKIFATEIEKFRMEYRITHPDRSADEITDAMLLREVLNTVGKPGKLGAHIRCVVSVNMLTEGWDANTVTHIMGLRAFGSQLLCEQVAGRALRRKSYNLDKDGKFPPEYAHIIGVPFNMFKGGKTVSVPPEPSTRIRALPEREKFEITFPRLNGYRIESVEPAIRADFSKIEPYVVDGARYPAATVMGSAFLPSKDELTLEQLRDTREQEIVYAITRYMINHYYTDDDQNKQFYKFAELKKVVTYWLRHKIKCVGDAFLAMLLFEKPGGVCDHIHQGIMEEQGRHDRILPVFNYYNRFGSTKHVNGSTTREVYKTKKSHVNYVVADTGLWEQVAAKTLDQMDEVLAYVKNAFLGFSVPYIEQGRDRQYFPDYIVRIRIPDGQTVNLILEITGFAREKEIKRSYVNNRWIPAVNAMRGKYGYDYWCFLEIDGEDELADCKNIIRTFIQQLSVAPLPETAQA
ncbi:MAG: BPTD_3080 family restriction endonuclease [Bacteroidota bacterium]|jgi:type III restriction enzyme